MYSHENSSEAPEISKYTAGQDVTEQQQIEARRKQVNSLIAEFRQATAEIHAEELKRRMRMTAGIAFIAIMVYYAHFIVFSYWWILLLIGGGAAAGNSAASGRQRSAAYALSKLDEPSAVGALAMMWQEGDHFIQAAADQALRTLLPKVRASDAAVIDREQMSALLYVTSHSDPKMQIAALQALQQIGDERAFETAQYLSLSTTPQVREMAKDLIPFLIQRAKRTQEQTTLLRASSSMPNATAPDELLRAAEPVKTETPTQELLRPASGDI